MEEKAISEKKYHAGAFCFIENVLIKDGVLYEELFHNLKDISLIKEVFLLTNDVDIERWSDFLISCGITWKLLSIHDLFGSEIEILFSSGCYANFFKKSRITIHSYNRID